MTIKRCIFLLSLSIITSDFEIVLIAKGAAWENLSSLVLCIHLACLLLAAIFYCVFRIIVRGSSPARCPAYCLNRELIFRFADRNTRTNRYA